MGSKISRTVQIQIHNETRNFTLENPRTYFYSGHSLDPPEPSVPPGCRKTCHFTNTSSFWGCNGVLAYEAESFALAIYFSNPIDYNRFSVELGLELSLGKAHPGDLRKVYNRMVGRSNPAPGQDLVSHRVTLGKCEEPARVSLGPVRVAATMSNGKSSVLKVQLEDSGKEAGKESRGPGKRVQEDWERVGPSEGAREQPLNRMDTPRTA